MASDGYVAQDAVLRAFDDSPGIQLMVRAPDLRVVAANRGARDAFQRGAHLLHIRRTRKGGFDNGAAGEIHRQVQAAREEQHERSNDQDRRQRIPDTPRGHEREVGRLMKKFHAGPL